MREANGILKDEYKPLEGFKEFDEDELPTNSDVTFIFEQYLSCFEKLRSDNIAQDVGKWYWVLDGRVSSIKTSPPKRLKN